MTPTLSLAGATVSQRNGHFVMENDSVLLSVDPVKGGKIDSYLVKATGRQLIGRDCFLLGDHFWQQPWPGEFLDARYEAKVVEAGAQSAVLEVSCVSKGWQGSSAQNGLRITRRMTLEADSPVLKVEIGISNTEKVGRVAGYWNQSVFYASGDKEERQLYFRPCIRGVSKATYLNSANEKTAENAAVDGFVRDVQNGWLAVLGERTQSGLAFVMRHDELMFLYNCLGGFTSEWQYKLAGIPSGRAWTTDFIVYPLNGLSRVDYASRNLAAAVQAKDDGGKLEITLTLTAAAKALAGVTISGEAARVRETGRPTTPFPIQRVAAITDQPSTVRFDIAHNPDDPLALRCRVAGTSDGKPFEDAFETWFGASYGRNWQVDLSPLYAIPVPPKHVTFLKPERIEKTKNAIPHVLLCRGPYVDDYLPRPIFDKMQAQVVPSRMNYSSIWPSSLDYFPTSYEELMSLDVIALINVDAEALGDSGQEMIKDFVTNGGTLVYAGDHWAYSRGHLSDQPLGKLLPVSIGSDGERHISPQSVMRVADGKVVGPLAKGAVMVYSGRECHVKEGAQVLLETDSGSPVMAAWNVGKGRVIAIAGTALGVPPVGEKLFTQTPEWTDLMVHVLQKNNDTEP